MRKVRGSIPRESIFFAIFALLHSDIQSPKRVGNVFFGPHIFNVKSVVENCDISNLGDRGNSVDYLSSLESGNE